LYYTVMRRRNAVGFCVPTLRRETEACFETRPKKYRSIGRRITIRMEDGRQLSSMQRNHLKPKKAYCPKCMVEVETIEKMGGHICSKCRFFFLTLFHKFIINDKLRGTKGA
jgi:hypothetical protein